MNTKTFFGAMKTKAANGGSFAVYAAVVFLGFGCASPNVNPDAARPLTGYVDLYADPAGELAWDVRRFDAGANQFKTVLFSTVEPVEGRVLRVALAPRQHRLTERASSHGSGS